MRAFLIQHVDALITTAAGLLITVYSWRARKRLRASPNKLVRVLPVLAPLVFLFGLLQFALDANPAYTWRRVATSDGHASAEFPCATVTESAVDSGAGVSLRRWTVRCNVPGKDIDLRLSFNELPPGSFNELPPEGAGLSLEERVAGMRGFGERQGFAVVSVDPELYGDVAGYRILLEQGGGKTRCLFRMAVAHGTLYRVVATSAGGLHDDPAIARFVESFRLE
jgi:hypothetical protein